MKDKKLVSEITAMDTDFAQWYTDVVKKAELIGYTSVKGCVIIRPYGYAIWENMQADLDRRFKETGHENLYMPLLIPESLLKKEADHVDGFAPECAWVTVGGQEELTERLCIRPTSEVLFCEHFRDVVQSYRDLPKLYNQWANVMRWEKTTRPFLRSREFLWQEGHTLHETEKEAREETLQMLECYRDFYHETLAIPVVWGRKTEKEKFAGAVESYTVEPMMHNGVGLQGGTSHYFGDGFARAFDIKFAGRDNTIQYPHQTSWGVSTRMMGAIVMVHGDDSGLRLPPRIAPVQAMIIPVQQHKEGVLEAASALRDTLKSAGVRVKLDDRDQSPGWKFAQHEMQGVPLRIELGPRDIEAGNCVLARRDTGEKIVTSLEGIADTVNAMLETIQADMFARALENLQTKTYDATSYDELLGIAENNPGFIRAMWCGDAVCEDKIKDDTGGVKSRCIPFDQEKIADTCVVCGKPAVNMVVWGRQY